jgi:hypothetical protein
MSITGKHGKCLLHKFLPVATSLLKFADEMAAVLLLFLLCLPEPGSSLPFKSFL